MNTYKDIASNRRLVRIGIVLGYAIALTLMITRIVNTEQVTAGETLGSIALGAAMAEPATLALLSLDRRPSLLPAAAIGALATSVIALWLLPIWLAIAFVWYRAWTGRPVPAKVSQKWAIKRVGLGFLMAASILALFVHLDPACTQRLTDGSTRSVDVASRGFSSGWVFGAGTTTSSGSYSSGPDVAGESCTSDTIVLGEALASLMITALVLETGRRWPQGTHSAAALSTLAATT
ncbi:MAG: hypothetical protein GY788_26700 [bacterium]|nr:hypothetical protein [bacterium]